MTSLKLSFNASFLDLVKSGKRGFVPGRTVEQAVKEQVWLSCF